MWANTDFLFRGEKMGKEVHQSIVIDVKATLDGMNEVVNKLNKGLREGTTKVDLTKGIGNSLSKYIDKFKDEYSKFTKLTEGGKVDFADSKEAIKSGEAIVKTFKEMQRVVGDFKDLSVIDAKKLFPEAFDSRVGELQKGLNGLYNAMNKLESKNFELKTAQDGLTELTQDAARFKEIIDSEVELKVDLDTATANLQTVEEKIEAIRTKAAEGITLKINAGEAKIGEAQAQLQQIQDARQTRGFNEQDFSKTSSGVLQFQGQSEASWTKITKSASASDTDKAKAQAAVENIRLYKQEEDAIKSLNQTISSEGAQVDNLKKKLAGFDKVKLSEAVRLGGGTAKDITNANKAMEELSEATSQADTAQGLYNAKAKEIKEAKAAYEKTTEAIEAQQTKIEKISLEIGQLNKEVGTVELTKAFETAGIEGFSAEMLKTKDGLAELKAKLDEADEKSLEKLKQELANIGLSADQADQYVDELRKSLDSVDDTSKDIARAAKDIENLKNQVLQFFSMSNAVQLFKRTVTSAINTVKELDAVMTEAAVVTDFSVGDMWDKLPEYTKNANQLGVATKELYGATTLYYQQGLKSNEAMELGVETMKMAKIAGLASADATKAMTAALRGFNMELNETSATRVNDVYSQLAAVTAADVSQISTAMEKTASIAASANMEFETTAALLAQIIETTQEAPETAGTAMKTIIARFSEVKSLRSQGQTTGTDSEGEAIDVNKIQTALGSVGISMADYFAGTEGLDQVLLRLSEKWNTLDFETQRYIATMAAGSRQQSRFIAMMSNYQRTTELVTQANNSAGASQKQFEKTTESLEYKLTQLKNAWDSFTMGLANNEAIKFGVDLLTGLLNTVNDLTQALSDGNGLTKAIVSLGIALGGLKLGKIALSGGLSFIGSSLGIAPQEQEDKASGGIRGFFSGKKAGRIAKQKTEAGLKRGQERIDKKKARLNKKNESLQSKRNSENISDNQKNSIDQKIKKNSDALTKLDKKQQAASKSAASFQISQEAVATGAQKISAGMVTAGAACIALGNILHQTGAISDEAAESWNTFGTILAGLGAIIPVVIPVIQSIVTALVSGGKKVSAAWITVTIIVLALVAIVAAVAAIISSTEEASVSLEEQLEDQRAAAERATQAANDAAETYDNFITSLDKLDEVENKFDGLVRGTKEWEEAIRENNEQVMNLVDSYSGLAEHVTFKDGKMIIDEEALTKKKAELESAKRTSAMGQYVAKTKEYDLQSKNKLSRFSRREKELIRALIEDPSLSHNRTKLIQLGFSLEDITDEIKEAAEFIANNENQQAILLRQSLLSGISEEAASSSAANQIIQVVSQSVQTGDITNQSTKDAFKWKDYGLLTGRSEWSDEAKELMAEKGVNVTGNTLQDAQNLYMAMTGKQTIEEIDEEIRTSEFYLLRAISEMQIAEGYVETTEKLIAALEKLPEDVGQAVLLGFGAGGSEETTIDNISSFKNMGIDQFLEKAGLTKEEYGELLNVENVEVGGISLEDATTEQLREFLIDYYSTDLMGKARDFRAGQNTTYKKYIEEVKTADAETLQKTVEKILKFTYGKDYTGQEGGLYKGKTWISLGGTYNAIDHAFEEYKKQALETEEQMVQKINEALQKTGTADFDLNIKDFEKIYGSFSSALVQSVIDNMNSTLTSNPQVWTNIIQSMREQNAHYVEDIQYLQSVNWENSVEALEAQKWMKEQGYSDSIITDYWKAATDAVNIYANGLQNTLELAGKLREDYNSRSELKEQLIEGSASDDAILKLLNQGYSIDDFAYTAKGWKMIDGNIEEAVNSLKDFEIQMLEAAIATEQAALDMARAFNQSLFGSKAITVNEEGSYVIDEEYIKNNKNKVAKAMNPDYSWIKIFAMPVEEIIKQAQEQADILNFGQSSIDIKTGIMESLKKGLEDNWESSLDKQFNLYQKINAELRKREKLERAYQRLLDSQNVSGQKLKENLQSQLSSLNTTIASQKLLADRKEGEIGTLIKESGFGKYVDFDAETGAIYYKNGFDPNKQFKNNSTEGQKFEDFIDELQGLSDQYTSAKEESDQAEDDKNEIEKELREATISLRTSIKDAILADSQKQIDKLTEINNSIQDANSRLIQSMQESLDKQRQERDNAKTEEELADKQRRLVYLQQDTSGANATEILKLQKEIEEGQESYTDKLIDQKINELQKQNDKAAEQRQEQIEIMTAQLEASEQNGTIWEEVDRLISNGITTDGKLKSGSELEALIKGSSDFKAMDELEQAEYIKNFEGKIAQAYAADKLDYTQGTTLDLAVLSAVGGQSGLLSGITKIVSALEEFAKNALSKLGLSSLFGFSTGGLADFTGPAWLDGTKSRPEYVLNAGQTEAFFGLVDVLESLKFGSTKTTQNNGDNTFDIDINVEKIDGDYDVEQMAEKIKTLIVDSSRYRNNNTL